MKYVVDVERTDEFMSILDAAQKAGIVVSFQPVIEDAAPSSEAAPSAPSAPAPPSLPSTVHCVDCNKAMVRTSAYYIEPPDSADPFWMCAEDWERMVKLALKGQEVLLQEKASA